MQSALDIINFFGKRYRIVFNADKTKLVVTGSKIDMNYYQDISPWSLNGEKIAVVEENNHLGLIVSGLHEEEKNIDNNIQQCRNSLYALLGHCYAFKCLLSPVVQTHLWRTYNLPVLRSGLSALPIRPVNIKSLIVFHNKIMRSFLKLSNSSPIPALHFLLGELPIEGRLHLDFLSLFNNIWGNPDTTIHKVVLYLLKMAASNSSTWSAHLSTLCQKYKLPNPLELLSSSTWEKERWSTLTTTRVTVWYEKFLRAEAESNSKMRYLNVQVQGLSGVPHPALLNISNTQDIPRLRLHIKYLSGDFLTGERLAIDNGSNPQCKLCSSPVERREHVLTHCKSNSDIHARMLPELLNTVLAVQPSCKILQCSLQSPYLTQFILDCTSLNLPETHRVAAHNPNVGQIFSVARNWCFDVSKSRARLLQQLSKTNVP